MCVYDSGGDGDGKDREDGDRRWVVTTIVMVVMVQIIIAVMVLVIMVVMKEYDDGDDEDYIGYGDADGDDLVILRSRSC